MKKIYLLLIAIIPVALIGQTKDYASLMDDPNASLADIQKAFQLNWAGKDRKSKGKGFKAFKRWEYFHQNRIDNSGKPLNGSIQNYSEYKTYFGLNGNNSAQRIGNIQANVSGTWTYIGPANGISTNGGAGRTNFIRFDPNNSSIIYTGSPAGGLWKSVNGGQSWSPLADEFASIGCSDIVIDPTNSNILYLATGDSDGKDTYSIGVLKSTDAGLTWSATGLMFNVNQSYTIAKMLIDPINTQIVYAATSNGLMKTVDGGVNWVSIRSNGFKDIEFKPFNSNTIYATAGASFWFSKDAGVTWSATPTNFGTSIGRSCIAVTPADSNYIYILGSLGASGTADDYGFGGIVRSVNGGQSFTLRSSTPNVLGWSTSGNDQGGQGWYDLALACSPINKDVIFTGGINLWKSTNGGTTLTNCSNWWGSGTGYVHADQHGIEFFPGSGTTVFVANDGGVFKSTNTGSSWSDISNGLKIAQQYNLGVSQTNASLTLTGWQDNGSNLHNGNASGEVLGGDGFECIISHANANEMYAELYYGDISKSTNGGSSFSNIVSSGGTGVDEDGAWNTPYIQHPTNPGTLLVGKSQVYRTTNGGNTWSQVGTLTNNGNLSKMAYAPSNPNYIYVTNGFGLWVTTNGSTFTNKTNLLPALNITGFAIDPTNPNIVYCSSSGYSSGNKVFLTTDAGNTWTNYSAGLPNVPCNHIVFQNNSYDALYLATDIGVFYRDSTMSHWMAYSNGLPNTIVSELEIQVSNGKLRAATYGRGLWETDLFTPPSAAPVAS
ncbi:MAG: WD40/YVTN/BNR-like repeat-containing protein, partial [Bacteroidota bacterium]